MVSAIVGYKIELSELDVNQILATRSAPIGTPPSAKIIVAEVSLVTSNVDEVTEL